MFSFMQQFVCQLLLLSWFFSLKAQMRGAPGLLQYSHCDEQLSALILSSLEGDDERRLDFLRLINKLDPELVMIDCRKKSEKLTKQLLIRGKHSDTTML